MKRKLTKLKKLSLNKIHLEGVEGFDLKSKAGLLNPINTFQFVRPKVLCKRTLNLCPILHDSLILLVFFPILSEVCLSMTILNTHNLSCWSSVSLTRPPAMRLCLALGKVQYFLCYFLLILKLFVTYPLHEPYHHSNNIIQMIPKTCILPDF